MSFFNLPFGKKNTPPPAQALTVIKPASVYPTDPAALTDFMRDKLARHCRKATSQVYRENGILGQAPDLYIAPRYVGLGVQLLDSNGKPSTLNLDKALRLARAIGVAAGVGDGTREPPVEAVFMGSLVVYRFALPEFSWARGTKVRLWDDVFLDNPALRGDMAVGLLPNGTPVFMELSYVNPNYLVCGVQGSGKTELMRTMVYQLMVCNSKDDVKIAIIDIKGDFEVFKSEEHLIWQPAHSFDEAKGVIATFRGELERRVRERQRDNALTFPHWVLVIDEADHQRLALDLDNQEHLQEVALRGRVYGMHLIIGTHRPDIGSIGDLGKELHIRYLGQQSSASDSGQIEGGLALHKLSGQGDYYVVKGGQLPSRFQVALVPPGWYAGLNRDSNIPAPPTAAVEPDIDVPTYERKAAHRPSFKISPEHVVYYVMKGPELVTADEANRMLGLSRDTGHPRTKQFAQEFVVAWEKAKGTEAVK